jgi:rhodanese-related sulfurtransferase
MQNITKEEWKKLVVEKDNAVVIDVRTSDECEKGMQPNAIQIDFMLLVSFLHEIDTLDRSKTYFLYCRTGNRSAQACMYMHDYGFKTYNLIGGMSSWDGDVVISK